MQYRTFGKTMERVSSLGFGCMRLPVVGGDHSVIDEAPATRMIHHAIEQGVNYFDTAWPYHSISMSDSGSSEPFLGRALAGGKRELVNVATKFPSWLLREPGDFDTYLNAQLRRLQTDHIDFYLIHAIGATSWPTLKRLEAGAFLERARKDGRIRFRGFSYHDTGELFMEVVDHFDWDFCLLQYNYLDVNYQAGRRR
ncbi:aldo/keto reductase, partial [Myxococcota bacterium]|nr:aldo/keto reductase [Myxococcota bacterium]